MNRSTCKFPRTVCLVWCLVFSISALAQQPIVAPPADAVTTGGELGIANLNTLGQEPSLPAPVGAIWVSSEGGDYRDGLRMNRFLTNLEQLPFSHLLVQVRDSADAYYESDLVPKAPGVPERFDPLGTIVQNLGEGPRAKQIYAWLAPYHAGNLNEATALEAHHVLRAHPDWLSRRPDEDTADEAGDMYLEPGLPAVQQHLEAVVLELIERYDLDGIYLDPMSDPVGDGRWGYHPDILEMWRQQTGQTGRPDPTDPAWIDFRARLINDALKELVRAIREVRANIVVAVGLHATGLPPETMDGFPRSEVYQVLHQDWPQWMSEGLADQYYLKSFWPEESARAEFNGWVAYGLAVGRQHKQKVIVGVAGRLNESVDALAQLRRAVEAGAAGLALADYQTPVRDQGSRELFLDAIGRTVLSPEYLSSMALINQTMERPITLPVIRRTGQETTPTAHQTVAAQPEAEPSQLELPPPPEVPYEERPFQPGEIEITTADEGRLISVDGQERRDLDTEDDTLSALERLAGGPDADTLAQQALSEQAPRILTRREMLLELLQQGRFDESRDFMFIRPTDEANRTLTQKFGNIF